MKKDIVNFYKKKYINFKDIEDKLKPIEISEKKGSAFEYFAFYYFNYYKEKYDVKNIYMENQDKERKIPYEIRNRLKLESSDHGVDGVIETNEDKLIAYQVKFRSSREGLTATELSTFWSESEYADHRIIFTNCTKLPKVSGKKINQSIVSFDNLIDLDTDFFDNLYNFYEKEGLINRVKHKPRDYQKEIIDEVVDKFNYTDRGKLIAACGVGKTLMSLWIQENLNTKNVLYIVPSLGLIGQTISEWTVHYNEEFKYISVCSDKTVTQSNEDNDEVIDDISDASFSVTTSPIEVSKFLSSNSNYKKVIFTTYHSLEVIFSAMMQNPEFIFDIAIFDESHRTAGSKYSTMFTLGLKDDFIKTKKRLFMTATERIVSNRVLQHANKSNQTIFSMDDEDLYGKTLSSINFGEAIEKGIINDYKIVISAMSEDDIKDYDFGSESVIIETGEKSQKSDFNVLLKQIILGKAINDLGIRKVISYHSFIINAKDFIFGYSKNENLCIHPLKEMIFKNNDFDDNSIYTNHINGSMSSGRRKDLLDEFKNSKVGVISNARCLTEGIDVPVVDAVYFADPKNSLIDIVQAVGRALRKPKNQKDNFSYIIIPLIISENDTKIEALKGNNYETILNVVQAMRMQDKRIVDEIDAFNYSNARNRYKKNSPLSERITIHGSDKINIDDLYESICLQISSINSNEDIYGNKKIFWEEEDARTSNIKRVFKSMGDYNLDSFRDSLIKPILNLFENRQVIPYKDVVSGNGHNNRSHTLRFGAIEKQGDNTYLTEIGKDLFKENFDNYDLHTKNQLLKYYSINKAEEFILFPYRTILKIVKETKSLTQLEFLYCIYILRKTTDNEIQSAVENIKYIRDTYPLIDTLNDSNKERVLKLLNAHFCLDLSYKDIWTKKTTAYNQFNYFRNHLLVFKEIFNTSKSGKILINEGSETKIENLLTSSELVESYSYDELDKLRSEYITF